jgi:hypothetical protein
LSHMQDPRTHDLEDATVHHTPSTASLTRTGMRIASNLESIDSASGIYSSDVLSHVRSVVKATAQHPLVVNSDITREIVSASMNRNVLRKLRIPIKLSSRVLKRSLLFTKRWVGFILRPLSRARLLPVPILIAFMILSAAL